MRPQRAKYCTGRSGGRKPIRKAAEVKILSLCDASSKASPSQILLPGLCLCLVWDGLNELDPGVAVSYCKDVTNRGFPVAWKISEIMKVNGVGVGPLDGVRVCDFQNLSPVAVVAFRVGTEYLPIFSNQLPGFRLDYGDSVILSLSRCELLFTKCRQFGYVDNFDLPNCLLQSWAMMLRIPLISDHETSFFVRKTNSGLNLFANSPICCIFITTALKCSISKMSPALNPELTILLRSPGDWASASSLYLMIQRHCSMISSRRAWSVFSIQQHPLTQDVLFEVYVGPTEIF